MLIAGLIIIQVIIFSVLIFIFRKILSQNVASATQHLDQLSQDYNQKEQLVTKQLDEAKVKASEIVSAAQDEADKLKLEILQSAESQRDKIIQQARSQGEEIIQQADKSRQKLLSDLDSLIEKEALNRGCQILESSLPEDFRQEAHKRWVQGLIKDSLSQLDTLNIPDKAAQAKVISAFALSEEERAIIFKKIKSLMGAEAVIKEEVDPKIIAGFIVSIGSIVVDGSLKNKIKEEAKGA